MLNKTSDKEQKFLKYWGKMRSRGRLKHAILLGLCGSLGALIAVLFLDMLVYKVNPLLASISGFVGGIIGSFNIWKKNEKRYSKLTNKLSN